MNVLYTIETHGPGGAESVLLRLAEGGAASESWTPTGLFIQEGWLADQFERRDFRVQVQPNPHTIDLPLLWRFLRTVRKERIDVIHAHELGMGFYAAVTARLLSLPCVITLHGRSSSATRSASRVRAYRFAMRSCRTVAVSHELATWISDRFGLDQDELRVIHNGVDAVEVDVEKVATHRREVRRELGIGDDAVVATTVGRLFAVKNHPLLLQAARRVAVSEPSTHFVLVGDGPERSRLQSLTASLGLDGRVHFLGERGDVDRILAASDLFVLPSLSEGLSIAILEAMAAGLPVVATDVGDNHFLIKNGLNGFLVESGDEEALADRVLALRRDSGLRRELGTEGRRLTRDHYSSARMLAQYRDVYEEALRGR